MNRDLCEELRSAARDINSLTSEELVLLFMEAAEQLEVSQKAHEILRQKRAAFSSLKAALELVKSELSKSYRLQNFSNLTPVVEKALAFSNH